MNTSNYNRSRNYEKSAYTLRGILSGVGADIEINKDEIKFLDLWLKNQAELPRNGDVLDLIEMITDILEDGLIDEEENRDIHSEIDCILKYGVPKSKDNEKCINELLGILMGISCDDKVMPEQFEFLDKWLETHPYLSEIWPVNLLAMRVEEIKEDGIVTAVKREHLLGTLKKITGTHFSEDGVVSNNVAEVYLDHITEFDHQGKNICFTGVFLSGSRKDCELVAKKLGAMTSKTVTLSVDVLVLGSVANDDWRYSSHGRKIEKAMMLKSKGQEILLISESTWQKFCL